MKRSLALLLTLVMSLGLLASCGSKDTTADESQQDGESGAKQIETLKVAFVPSREPQEIITATEPLKQLLKDELAKEGYEVGEVEITVGTTYEAVGEGLEAGTIDVGLIPGGTYVLYDDGAEVILTATRDGLNKDSDRTGTTVSPPRRPRSRRSPTARSSSPVPPIRVRSWLPRSTAARS